MKKIRLALLDFDGTLVTQDVLDILCDIVGKREESQTINEAFHRGELPGLSALVTRINFLTGVSQQQINDKLKENSFLMPGTRELMQFFKDSGIVTILASGNIEPVLRFYQMQLGIDYIVGSKPKMNGDVLLGIDESAYSSKTFKLDGINHILAGYSFKKEDIIALGDSPSDKGMFEMSGLSIAVNPKGDIAESANYVVENDLTKVIKIIQSL